MQKKIIFTGLALTFLGTVVQAAGGPKYCGEKCSLSNECADSCGVCISGYCDHRCANMDSIACFIAMSEEKQVESVQEEDLLCDSSVDCVTRPGTICVEDLDGVKKCQHRCLVAENPLQCMENINSIVKGASCNSVCSTYADCGDAGSCNMCLDGTCQHRCFATASPELCLAEEAAQNATPLKCNDKCTSSLECNPDGKQKCNLCLSGICQERCSVNPFANGCMDENIEVTPVNEEKKTCKTFADCDDEYNWFCEIPSGKTEGTCEHRCIEGKIRCAIKSFSKKLFGQ
jgi:hypothetical protein